MKIKKYKVSLLLLLFLFLSGCNLLIPDKRDSQSEVSITLEVDGKIYKVERRIQSWITYGWDASRGNTKGRRSDYGIFGQKIHNRQAIVISFTPFYTREYSNWSRYYRKNKQVFSINEPEKLKKAFKILLLDHYNRPKVIEVYDNVKSYESPQSRIKILEVSSTIIPASIFSFFTADGKDRYYDYLLSFDRSKSNHKDAEKYFETVDYRTTKLTPKVIDRIISKFPHLEPVGIYRLPNSYEGNSILGIINRAELCSIELPQHCKSYRGKKVGNFWTLETKEYPLKIYFSPRPLLLKDLWEKEYMLILDGKELRVKNEREYLNSFINFDTSTFSTFKFGYMHTRDRSK